MLAGASGVTLFFVLSGFLLFLPFANALLYQHKWPSTRRFYLRRVSRIVPAYYASLILMVLVFHPEYLQPQRWQELGLFFIFFMDSTRATWQHLNGPFWTLAVEWQYYMVLPLLVLGMSLFVRGNSPQRRVWTLVCCLIGVMAWGVFSRFLGGYLSSHPTQTLLIPRTWLNGILFFAYGVSGKYLEDFAVGMLISCIFVFSGTAASESRSSQWLRRLSPWLWWAGILLLLFMAMWHFDQSYHHSWPLLDGLLPYYDWLSEIGLSLGFGLCVLALLYGSTGLKRLFEWPLLRWIGLISFSLYMWHLPLLIIFMNDVGTHKETWNHVLVFGLYWLWAIVLVIPFSFLFYLFFEKPGMKLGERLLRGRDRSVPKVTPGPQEPGESASNRVKEDTPVYVASQSATVAHRRSPGDGMLQTTTPGHSTPVPSGHPLARGESSGENDHNTLSRNIGRVRQVAPPSALRESSLPR